MGMLHVAQIAASEGWVISFFPPPPPPPLGRSADVNTGSLNVISLSLMFMQPATPKLLKHETGNEHETLQIESVAITSLCHILVYIFT